MLACAVAAQAVALSLVLRTPYWFDDASNANLHGYLRQSHQSLGSWVHGYVDLQWNAMGRFAPVGLYENYGLMDVLHDRVAYKLFLVAMTILSVLAVARVLTSLRVPAEIALLAAGLTAALFQLHTFHDGLYAYAAILQILVLLYCASLLLFIGWLRRGGWWRLALSLAFVVVADLFYEAAYLLVVLHVAVLLAERQPLRKAAGPVLISLAFVVLTAYLRLAHGSDESIYRANVAPGEVVPAFLKQLSATLPTASLWSADGPSSLPSSGSHTPWLRGALIGALLLPLLWTAAARAKDWRPDRRTVGAVAIIAAALLTLPALLVSLAVRYQTELRWGTGYLPVVAGVIGTGIFGALAYAALARRLPVAPLALVVAALLGLGAVRNAEGGTRVVSLLEPVAAQRDDFDDAVHHGLFADATGQEVVLFDQTQIAPPVGFWLAAYGMTMKQWFETISPRSWSASYELNAADETAQRCPPSDPNHTCRELGDHGVWFTTGVAAGQRRWILLTPVRRPPAARDANLFATRPGPTAQLVVEDGGDQPLAGVAASWKTKEGAPVPAVGTPRVVRRSGRWTFAEVPVPKTATAGTGTVTVAGG